MCVCIAADVMQWLSRITGRSDEDLSLGVYFKASPETTDSESLML